MFAVGFVVCLVFLIAFVEIRDRRMERREKDFFQRAIRVCGTVTDFGLPEVESRRSQSFSVIYEIDGKQYSVDSGLLAKGNHVFAVGEKVIVFVDPLDHSKARLAINQLKRSPGNPYGEPKEVRWYK